MFFFIRKNFEVVVVDTFINSHQKSLDNVYEIFRLNNHDVMPIKILDAILDKKKN